MGAVSSPCLVHHVAVAAAITIPIAAIAYAALWWEPPLRAIPNSSGICVSGATNHSDTSTSEQGSATSAMNHNERCTERVKTTIERLRVEREGVVNYLRSLDAEIEREEMSGMPVEPSEPFAVVAFIKVREDDQQPLNYAAIRNGDRWVLTQDSRSNYPQRSRCWDELMRWIGPDEWPTVRVLADKRDNPVSGDQIVNYHVNGHVSDIDGWLSKRDNQLRGQQL